jgi:hypothetical protein
MFNLFVLLFAIFVIRSYVVCAFTREDFIYDFDDHGEPDAAQSLEEQKKAEKIVSDVRVPANWAVLVIVGLEKVAPGLVAAVGFEGCGVGERNEELGFMGCVGGVWC